MFPLTDMDREEFIREIGQIVHPSFSNFNFDDYGRFLEMFPFDRILGPITSEEMAKAGAEAIWVELFGKHITIDRQPFLVLYDESSDVWFLAGTLPPDFLGSVPHIFIRGSDGQVLAVWMG